MARGITRHPCMSCREHGSVNVQIKIYMLQIPHYLLEIAAYIALYAVVGDSPAVSPYEKV